MGLQLRKIGGTWGQPPSAVQIVKLRAYVERPLDGAALGLNLLLQKGDGINQLLGTRRATRYINIYRYDLIDALHQRVIVKHAARGRTRPHGDYPLRFRHLLPELADHRRHFVGNSASDDHQIRLARRRPKNFSAETRNIKTRGAH